MVRQSTESKDADRVIECNSIDLAVAIPGGATVNGDPIYAGSTVTFDLLVSLDTDGTQLFGAFGPLTPIRGFSVERQALGVYRVFDLLTSAEGDDTHSQDPVPADVGLFMALATVHTTNRRIEVTDFNADNVTIRTFNAGTNAAADAKFTVGVFTNQVTPAP